FSLIENAQRSANGISDFMAIKDILSQDKSATYKSIAQAICKSESYIKTIDRKYAKVPHWALNATMAGDIAETTALLIGTFGKEEQKQCHDILKKDNKLSHESAQQIRRFIQKETMASFAPGLGFNEPQGQEFYPRCDVETISQMLEAKKYPELRKFVATLLAK
ncbi:MAG: hypothetical protein Q8M94_00290, partial [Ignavibacteria bacterium]|nr:hypothetical protein [Ignavibacteria bacterium]